MNNDPKTTTQVEIGASATKLDERIRAMQDAILRLECSTPLLSAAAKDAARILIAEKQVEQVKDMEKLRWEFRHFERIGKLWGFVASALAILLTFAGIKSLQEFKFGVEKTLADKTSNFDALYRGLALQAATDFRGSITYLNSYLASDPYDETALAAIFKGYIETGDAAEARNLIVRLKSTPAKFAALHQPFVWINMATSLLSDAAVNKSTLSEAREYFNKALTVASPEDDDAHYWIYRNGCVAAWLDDNPVAASEYVDSLSRMSPSRKVPDWKQLKEWAPFQSLSKTNPEMMSTAAKEWSRLKDRYSSGS